MTTTDKRSDIEHFAYVPYSTRYNISDERLAKLFNYLERVLTWDLGDPSEYIDGSFLRIPKDDSMEMVIFRISGTFSVTCYNLEKGERIVFTEMVEDIFFESFETLLPLAKNYAKKVLNS